MTISNGYCTLAEFKANAIPNAGTNSADDAVIEDIIEGASRRIDTYTGRTFYARTETHYYDSPDGEYDLWIHDDDLLTVSSITNGDGTTISSGSYKLLPLNKNPKYQVYLKPSSNLVWSFDSNSESLGSITIAGTWGYSSTAPDDIKQACIMLASAEYRKRFGENSSSIATVTGAGVVITPQGMPKDVADILEKYKKLI
jgi:hypothetical protein